MQLLTHLNSMSDLALTIATVSIVVCPTLCGIMAYRVSRTYDGFRNAS